MHMGEAIATVETCLREQLFELHGSLAAVCRYALEGGSRMRAKLLLQAAGCKSRSGIEAAVAIEMLHAATLLQDDIFDGSVQRRGRVAAHVCFGTAQAVLASDWLLIRALELAASVHVSLFRHLAKAAVTMTESVASELEPTILQGPDALQQQIEAISQGKTAVLFASALYAAALLQQRSVPELLEWEQLGSQIGCVYQLLDDALDVYASSESLGKGAGEDLLNGRLTLPQLLAYHRLDKDGSPIRFVDWQTGQLTPYEKEDMRCAMLSPPVKSGLRLHIEGSLERIRDMAQRRGIAEGAIESWISDLDCKLQLCFGATGQGAPLQRCEAAAHNTPEG